MDFVDKLNEKQLTVAEQIVEKAKEMGIPPRLALSIAFHESGLDNSKIGADKEVGIMQVKPTTAQMLGFDPKELRDPSRNIEIGLTYLKQGMDRYKDPMLATMGYNTGYDHQFLTGESDKIPPSVVKYVDSIKSLGGFTEPEEGAPAEAETAAAEPAPQKTVSPTEEAAMMGALAGGLLGTTVKGAHLLRGTDEFARGAQAAGRTFGGGTPGEKWAQKVTGYVRPGMETVSEAAQQYQRAKPSGKVTGRLAQMYGPPPPPQPGVFTGGRLAGMTPPPAPLPTGEKILGGLRQVSGAIGRAPITAGALAGAGAAGGAQEAYQRSKAGDKVGAAIAGAGALGSAASMIPTLPTRIIGGGLAMASPAALYILDRMRDKSAQKEGALSQVDAMGNPL